MRKITNGQLSLEDLGRRLCSKVHGMLSIDFLNRICTLRRGGRTRVRKMSSTESIFDSKASLTSARVTISMMGSKIRSSTADWTKILLVVKLAWYRG